MERKTREKFLTVAVSVPIIAVSLWLGELGWLPGWLSWGLAGWIALGAVLKLAGFSAAKDAEPPPLAEANQEPESEAEREQVREQVRGILERPVSEEQLAKSAARTRGEAKDRAEAPKPKYFRKYEKVDSRHCAYGRVPEAQAGELSGPWTVIRRWTEVVDVFRMHDEEVNHFVCWRETDDALIFAIARDGATWLNDTRDPDGYLEDRTVIQFDRTVRVEKSDRQIPELAGELKKSSEEIAAIVAGRTGA